MYIIADAKEVFLTRREPYLNALKLVEQAAERRAREVLGKDLRFGGLIPKEGEYAKVTLRPEMFKGMAGTALSGSFRQNLTSTGWQTILTTDLSENGPVGEKWVMGLVGIAILDPVIRISQIKITKGDKTFSVIDIEEAKVSRGPVVILFKISQDEVDEFVFDYSADFSLKAYITSTGYQTVKPEGIAFLSHKKAISETYS